MPDLTIDMPGDHVVSRHRWRRWAGVVGLASQRLRAHVTGGDRTRTLLSVLGVALVIALVVIVTGVGLGLVSQTTIHGEDVDYWIVPDRDGPTSTLVAPGGPQFGGVHEANARIVAEPGVAYATPVLVEVVRAETTAGSQEYVLAVGIVPAAAMGDVVGLPTEALTPGDPYHAAGGSEAAWTGELVASQAAASLLDVGVGESATLGEQPFTVVAVGDEAASLETGSLPIVLVQLGELQALTGTADGDRADQFLVSTTDPGVESTLASLYPRSSVTTRSGLLAEELFAAELPLAMSAAALLVGLVLGTLFLVTMRGLDVAADATQLATLSALGVSYRTRLGLVTAETLAITLAGGLVGAALGFVGISAANHAARTVLSSPPVAQAHPALGGYALAVALVIGLLAIPYLAVVLGRLDHRGAEP